MSERQVGPLLLMAFLLFPALAISQEVAENSVAPMPGVPTLLDGRTSAERAQALIGYCAGQKPTGKNETYPKVSTAAYAARLLIGEDTAYALEKINSAVDQTLKVGGARTAPAGQKRHALDPFNEEALMYTYLVTRDKIPPETAANYLNWPRLENPWMKSNAPSEIDITDGKANSSYRLKLGGASP